MSQNCGSEPERKEIYVSEVRHTSVAMETLSSTEAQKDVLVLIFVSLTRH